MKNIMDSVGELGQLKFKVDLLNDDLIEIRTPFTNHLNDLIMLYIVSENEMNTIYKITDDGYTLNEFNLMGVDVYSQQEHIDCIADEFGVIIEGVEVFIESNEIGLIDNLHQIIMAVRKIDQLLLE